MVVDARTRLDRVALVTTAKAPPERLRAFLDYHLNIGVERVFLFLDDPDGDLPDSLDDPRIVAIRCDAQHWERLAAGKGRPSVIEERQILNATHALGLARRGGLDWLVHLDVDELVATSGASLPDLLTKVAKSVDRVAFRTLEAVPPGPRSAHGFLDVTLFKSVAYWRWDTAPRRLRGVLRTVTRAGQFGLARLVGCGNVFFDGEYFRGHTHGKSATRTTAPVDEIGLHAPTGKRRLTVRTSGAGWLLHFDCLNVEEWVVKWQGRYDGTATASHMRPNRRRQGDLFVDLWRSNDQEALEALFAALYCIPPAERRRLELLRLVRRVELDPTLFDPPTGV